MKIKLLLALLIFTRLGSAYREDPPSGTRIYHTIQEGHDLILSCPVATSVPIRDFAVEVENEENDQLREAAGNGEGEADATSSIAATTADKEGSSKSTRKGMILWTRNQLELFSINGEDFFELSKAQKFLPQQRKS